MISPTGQNLVFLLSAPRSGSTLLSVLLNQLPEVYCPPEPWFLLRLLSLDGRGNPDAPYNDDFATIGTHEFLGKTLPPDPVRAFACSAYNQKLVAAGKSLFVDKTPRYYHILPQLEKLFPKARYIWLQRNPLDVVASYKTTWKIPVGELFGEPARPETLDFVQGFDALRDFFTSSAENKLCLRYEELAADSREAINRIQAFLGLKQPANFDGQITRTMLADFKPARVGDPSIHGTRQVHTQSIDRWRTVLTPGEIKLVLGILGAGMFRDMGYESALKIAASAIGRIPSDATALERRRALRATALGRLDALSTQLTRMDAQCREQTDFIAVLAKERDRLTLEAKAAQTELSRASKDGQKHIDSLRRQIDKLAATSLKQTDFITLLEKERDRLAQETKEAQAERSRASKEGQKHIDSLRRQIDKLAATSLKQTDFITLLEKERGRLTAETADLHRRIGEADDGVRGLKKQLDQLAATSLQQAEYLAILEKERDRLLAANQSLAKDSAHYVAVMDNQNRYIQTLEAQRPPPGSPSQK